MRLYDYLWEAFEGNNKGYTETEYGEPQVWICLKSGRSMEITHEMNGLDEDSWYYSIRLHCSEKEFDDDIYHSTMGVIDTMCVNQNFDYMYEALIILMTNYKEEWEGDNDYERREINTIYELSENRIS